MSHFELRSRREFLRDLAAVAALSSAGAAGPAVAAARKTDDSNDRSPTRDPLAIHRSTIVINGLDPSSLSLQYLDMLRRGGVTGWLRAEHQMLGDFAITHDFQDRNRDRIVPARTVREIRAAHAQGKIAQIQGWQSAEQLSDDSNQGALTGPALINLRAYYEMGLRSCGIAYNLANEFGAGCLEPEKGLTRNGRKLVEELHRLRIVLDVGGHTGEQTSLDALAMSAGVPVVCTHTNVKALNDNPRCTSDRVFEAIARTGGVIGITSGNDFHVRTRNDVRVLQTPQATLDKHLDQYDYIKKLVGIDHVGLGPDFTFGGTKPSPRFAPTPAGKIQLDAVPDRNGNGSELYGSPETVSPQPPWLYIKGFEAIDELPNVTRGLIQRGWATGEIRKLLGENWLRVYEKVWGE